MEHPGYLDNILVFLVTAVVIVFAFRSIRVSSVLGYLVAGILVGPHMTGFVSDPADTQFLGELGVVFLLFTIGLELPVQRLMALGKFVFGLGVAQVVITCIVITSMAVFLFGFSIETSILLGGALALSSTAVVLQVLNERKEMAASYGRASFSVLLLQDLAVVLILVLTTTIGMEGTSVYAELAYAGLKALIAFTAIIGIGRLVLRPIYRVMAATDSHELFMATSFLVVLGTSFITEVFGLSMELGAFLAGMLLAETEYRHQIEADIEPFRGLLLGVFFMSVGMRIDLHVLISQWYTAFFFLSLLLTIKAAILFGLARAFHLRLATSISLALLLAGGGEFVFVIFTPQVAHQFLPDGMVDLLFVIITLSMALTPLMAFVGGKISSWFVDKEEDASLTATQAQVGELRNHVILAGYGHVGQLVTDILAEKFIPYVAIDNDMRRVTEGRKKGLPVYYGDARKLELLRAIGAEDARAAVITLNQMTASVGTVQTLRRHFPDLPVCVRIRDGKHNEKLLNSGAYLVTPETLEPSLQLATSVLNKIGMPPDEINQTIESHRKQYQQIVDEVVSA